LFAALRRRFEHAAEFTQRAGCAGVDRRDEPCEITLPIFVNDGQ
jgi:hypothetical protein